MYDNINTKYQNATLLIDEASAEDCIKLLNNKIESGPASAENYAYLSKAYIFCHKYEEALTCAQKSIEIQPDYAYGIARVGYAFARLKNNEMALKYCEQAEKMAGDNDVILIALLKVYYGINEPELGKKIANKITKLLGREDADFYLNQASAHIYLDNYEKALLDCKKARKADENLAATYGTLSSIYLNLKKPKLSLACADKAISINPNYIFAHDRRGWVLYRQNRYEEALESFLKTEALGYIGADTCSSVAYIYGENNEYEKSLEYANKAISKNKNDNYAYFRKGWALYKLQRFDEALVELFKAEELGCKSTTLYPIISFIYSYRNEHKEAIKYASKAILLDKNDAYAYYRKGFDLYQLEMYDEALAVFLKAEGLGCEYEYMYSKLAFIYNHKSEPEKAIEYANKAILQDSNSGYAYYMKGWGLYQLEQYDVVLAVLLKAEELGCNIADMYSRLSFLYSQLNERDKALQYADKAILLDVEDDYAHFCRGWELYCTGEYAKALKSLTKAKELGHTYEKLQEVINICKAKASQ